VATKPADKPADALAKRAKPVAVPDPAPAPAEAGYDAAAWVTRRPRGEGRALAAFVFILSLYRNKPETERAPSPWRRDRASVVAGNRKAPVRFPAAFRRHPDDAFLWNGAARRPMVTGS
jgi:hypothetical protein